MTLRNGMRRSEAALYLHARPHDLRQVSGM